MSNLPTGRLALGIAFWTFALVVAFAGYQRFAQRVSQATLLIRQSKPFSTLPELPVASLLIVGDSTAVGTGASSPQTSLAGRIADAYPQLLIRNLAKAGATFDEIADQLIETEPVDLILISGGANDVIRLTATDQLSKNINLAIDRALMRARHVIVMPAPNVGNAPFFPPLISRLLTHRAKVLHDACRASVRLRGVAYVDLYRDKGNDPFVRERLRLIASDDLHPSDEGYAVWFAELDRQALSHLLLKTTAVGATVNDQGGST